MKRILLLFICVFFSHLLVSQTATYSVQGTIKLDESSIEAKQNERTDINDNPCALVIISKGGVHGLKFDLKGFSPCGMEEKESEYYLWIPANTRIMYLKHPDRGNLEVTIPTIIKQGKTYKMYLLSNVVAQTTYKKVKPERVTFLLDPPNARYEIFEAGESGKRIQAPRKAVEGKASKMLSNGKYRLVLSAPRYDKMESEIVIVPEGLREFNFSLVPDFAEVTLSTKPQTGATILVDGIEQEQTTPATIRINPGMTTITLEMEDFGTLEFDTLIEKQREYLIEKVLKSTVSMSSIVTNDQAEIYIDDEKIAMGNFYGKMLDGLHHISIERPQYYTFDTIVNITAGVPFNLDKKLLPIQGMLVAESTPDDADLYVDGKLMGKTPQALYLQIGTHNIEIRKSGYAPEIRSITLAEDQELNLNPVLSKSMDIIINSNPTGSVVYKDEGNGFTYAGTTPYTYIPLGSNENLKFRIEQDGYNPFTIEDVYYAGKSYSYDLEKVSVAQKMDRIIASNEYVDMFDGRTDLEFNYYLRDNYGFEMRSTRYKRYFHFAVPLTNVAYRSIPIETNTFDPSTGMVELKDQELNTLTTAGLVGLNYGFGNENVTISFDLDAYLYGGIYFTGGEMSDVQPIEPGATHYGYGLDGSLRVNFGGFYIRARTSLYNFDNLVQEGLSFSDEFSISSAQSTENVTDLPAVTLGIGFNLTSPYDNSLYEQFGSNDSYSGYWGFVLGSNSYDGTRLGMFFKSFFGGGWYGSMNFNYDYSSIPAYSFLESGEASASPNSPSVYNNQIAQRKANGDAADDVIEYSTLSLIDYELGYGFGFYESGSSSLMLELNMYAGFGFSFLEDGVGELADGEDLYGLGFKYFLGFRPRIVYAVEDVFSIYAETTIYEYDNHLSNQLYYMTDQGTNTRKTLVTDPDISFVPMVTLGMGFPF